MEQHRVTVFIFALLLSSIICGQNKVNYLSSNENIIALRVTVYASKVKKAIEIAELEAVKAILFRGIPGSQQSMPLVGVDENKWINDYPEYFRTLINDKRYSSFILSSVPQTGLIKDVTKKKCITMDISVNLKALRTDLEQQNIIRKFGL